MSALYTFVGPDLPALEQRAFAQFSDDISPFPDTLLYLAPFHRLDDEITERWETHGRRDSLNILTLDDFAGDTIEQAAAKGKPTHIDRALLYRLVEQGLEAIDDETNPLATPGRLPSAGLTEATEDLFTRLEFAGLLSPVVIEQRLRTEGLRDRAAAIETLAANIETARDEMLADELPETFRTERMHAATTTDTSFETLWPNIDAVVVGGLTRLRPLEQRLLKRILDTWPTAFLLPKVTAVTPPVGVDETTATVSDFVAAQAVDTREHIVPDNDDTPTVSDAHTVAKHLFRHADDVPEGSRPAGLPHVELIEPETATTEIRHVARDIRARLNVSLDPSDVGIALPAPESYRPLLTETLDQYDIPTAVATEVSFGATAVGEAALSLCDLADDQRDVEAVLGLLSNPLVTLDSAREVDVHQQLAHTAARSESRAFTTILAYLPTESANLIEDLLAEITALNTGPLDQLPARLEDLLERIGLEAAVEAQSDLIEQEALTELRETTRTVALTNPVADTDLGTPAERLARALQNGTIRQASVREDAHVIICDCNEATRRDFDRLYILGLTEATVPATREELTFVAPIFDAHPDFDRTDPRSEFRHQFGQLLAATEDLILSVPQRTEDGDPHVPAEVVSELQRVVDIESTTVTSSTAPPGTAEDIQQSMGAYLGDDSGTVEAATESIESAHDAGTFDDWQRTRLRQGVECADARASERLTPYDGQLTPETLAAVHGQADRAPYSASRLETYAACGFKYYMEEVLGIEEPDKLTIEPDALAKGTYIHDVLEHYYRRLQADLGTPIPIAETDAGSDVNASATAVPNDERAGILLDVALERLDKTFEHGRQAATAYHEEWLTKVLAGLGTPTENPYYTSGEYDAPEAGLFARFLAAETADIGLAAARPAWFEPRVGEQRADEVVLQQDPVEVPTDTGTVPIIGQIDRIDTVPGTTPTQAVVRDYKTGSTPSEADTLGGLKFQLPLYALLAEATIDDLHTVGESYYKVEPSPSLSHRQGQIGSEEHTGYVRHESTEKPMGTKQSYPEFDTHAAFRAFLDEVVPRRLDTITRNIDQGRFHPTVLDPDDAGCSYCPHADVCDVRSHRRHAVIEWLDDSDVDSYVPPIATDAALPDALGVSIDG